jgi:hypothetical protein
MTPLSRIDDATGLFRVVAGNLLRGVDLPCTAPVTVLVDGDPDHASVGSAQLALRLFAGIESPRAGKVSVLGRDPAEHAALRRSIALLGDDVLVDPTRPLVDEIVALARVREVASLSSPSAVVDAIAALGDVESATLRRAMSDRIAEPSRASMLLVSHPERYREEGARDAILDEVRAAIARGVKVVIATRALDEVLPAIAGSEAIAAVLRGGVVVVAGPAHGLPWAIPAGAAGARLIRVAVHDDDARDESSPAPAAALASDLFADPEVAPVIVAIEPLGATELRLHVRDPRVVSRAIAARAHRGVAIARMVVYGASADEIAAAYAQGARW